MGNVCCHDLGFRLLAKIPRYAPLCLGMDSFRSEQVVIEITVQFYYLAFLSKNAQMPQPSEALRACAIAGQKIIGFCAAFLSEYVSVVERGCQPCQKKSRLSKHGQSCHNMVSYQSIIKIFTNWSNLSKNDQSFCNLAKVITT